MNELNEKGERHGYWELFYVNKNYYNGIKHGQYEYYWNKEKTTIFKKGQYDMGVEVGLWEYYTENNVLYKKKFYL